MFKKKPLYKITERGIEHYERVKDSYWKLALSLVLGHLVENPSGVYLKDFNDISVNAEYLLEDLCKQRYAEKV